MRCRIIQFARKSVGLCPFRGSYVREFELSHSNPRNRIIKITHAHNLHGRCWTLFLLQFVPKTTQIVHKTILKNSSNVKVDSLTFISFQENYQTGEIYVYSYHVFPLNKAISN